MTSINHLIRKILAEGSARTQLEIQQELEKRGYTSSQSKISRLLHQIGAVKIVDNHGKTQYRLPHDGGLIHELTSPQEKASIRQWILDITSNETLVVIHTTPGAAMMVARIVDQDRNTLNILGTIAGDDTIFIAPKQNRDIAKIQEDIARLLGL